MGMKDERHPGVCLGGNGAVVGVNELLLVNQLGLWGHFALGPEGAGMFGHGSRVLRIRTTMRVSAAPVLNGFLNLQSLCIQLCFSVYCVKSVGSIQNLGEVFLGAYQ